MTVKPMTALEMIAALVVISENPGKWHVYSSPNGQRSLFDPRPDEAREKKPIRCRAVDGLVEEGLLEEYGPVPDKKWIGRHLRVSEKGQVEIIEHKAFMEIMHSIAKGEVPPKKDN